MIRESINFKLLAPYFQEQNKVSKKVGWTIIDIIYITILDGSINDDF